VLGAGILSVISCRRRKFENVTAVLISHRKVRIALSEQILPGNYRIEWERNFRMDLITIATFISLQIASGFLKEHGKEIYGKVKELLRPEELVTLNLLENQPGSAELQQQVAGLIGTQLGANPDLARECEALLKEFRASITIKNQITQQGDGNIAMQDIQGSQININK
jgi:hypothetical protein